MPGLLPTFARSSLVLVLSGFVGLSACDRAGGGERSPDFARAPTGFPARPLWEDWSRPFYQSEDNFLIQSLQIGGRLNYQWAHLRGRDVEGRSFSESYDELRRLWIGGKVEFLRHFQAGGNAIFASDERPQGREVDLAYQKCFDLYVAADLKGLFDWPSLDRLRFRYGRIKHSMSYTGRQSQRFNKTVERSALANKLFYPFAAMSATLDVDHGEWGHQFSLYGTANGGATYGSLDEPEWGNWDEGLAIYWWNRYDYSHAVSLDRAQVHVEGAYNFAGEDDSSWMGYRWAGTISTYLEDERWSLLLEAACGDNGDESIGLRNPDRQGLFWGGQIEATYWLHPQRLEGVLQFAWMGAENSEGIRIDRRYVGLPHRTNDGGAARFNERFGSDHRSVYLGLNCYLPDDRQKIMCGAEWEGLETEEGRAGITTFWTAYRMFF